MIALERFHPRPARPVFGDSQGRGVGGRGRRDVGDPVFDGCLADVGVVGCTHPADRRVDDELYLIALDLVDDVRALGFMDLVAQFRLDAVLPE